MMDLLRLSNPSLLQAEGGCARERVEGRGWRVEGGGWRVQGAEDERLS